MSLHTSYFITYTSLAMMILLMSYTVYFGVKDIMKFERLRKKLLEDYKAIKMILEKEVEVELKLLLKNQIYCFSFEVSEKMPSYNRYANELLKLYIEKFC